MTRIGILISGRGSNMLALDDAVRAGQIPDCEIAIVISDQRGAPGLVRAEERGLKTLVVERRGRSREDHDSEIVKMLKAQQVDLVCLAGYMRLLSKKFLSAFPNRILNIHPSLLPAFPGLNAQKQALDHGVKWSGCTVHLVDEQLDGGPIVAQRIVPVLPDDTPETLSERILEQEHQLYPEAVKLLASGRYEVIARRVIETNMGRRQGQEAGAGGRKQEQEAGAGGRKHGQEAGARGRKQEQEAGAGGRKQEQEAVANAPSSK